MSNEKPPASYDEIEAEDAVIVESDAPVDTAAPEPEESDEEVVAVITPNNIESSQETLSEEEPLSAKAEHAGESIKDLLESAAKKAKDKITEKSKHISKQIASPQELNAKVDARDIGRLGPRVENLAAVFEDTMIAISKQPYDRQVELLAGYNRLVQGQIDVINSRIDWVKRVGRD